MSAALVSSTPTFIRNEIYSYVVLCNVSGYHEQEDRLDDTTTGDGEMFVGQFER
jgi:hypothetical protein